MPAALIIDACRTPRGIGKQGKGALAHLHPQHLGATVLKALVDRNGFDTAEVDDIIWGTSAQVVEQSGDLGRMSALDAGYDVKASGVTLDRFCGSGITSVNFGATSVMAGMEDLVIAGGPSRGDLDDGDAALLDRILSIADPYTTGTYDSRFAAAWSAMRARRGTVPEPTARRSGRARPTRWRPAPRASP